MSGEGIRHAVIRADLAGKETYSAHSLRAGGATAATKAGAPVSAIARQGRWSEKSPGSCSATSARSTSDATTR